MTMSKIKTIGILTSGGDAPGMNAAIRAVTRAGIYNGFKIKGIYRGYEGLIHDEVKEFTTEDVSGIITRGGTPSARDRILASCTGVGAIEAIMQGQRNVMIGIRNNDIVYVPFSECIRTDKRFDKRLITVLDELSI